MICNVKLSYQDAGLFDRLRRNIGLPVGTTLNTETGELFDQSARIYNLQFKSYPSGRNEIRGSLHLFANQGQHNADQFTYERLCQTIQQLADLCEFEPATVKIEQLEAGVNLPFTSKVLQQLIAYKGQTPDVRSFNSYGHERRWDSSEYYIKAYDKQRQYNWHEPVLRWEVGTHKMRFLAAHGISIETLADLTDPQRMRGFGELLASLFSELTFDDITKLQTLSAKDRAYCEKVATTQFWENITDRRLRSYYRERFDELRAKYGANERERVTDLIRQTSYNLVPCSPVILDNFTGIREVENWTIPPFKYIVNSSSKKPAESSTSTAPIEIKIARVCLTCGTDISHRNPSALYCSQKKCRNTESNPRNNFKRLYKRLFKGPTLYESAEVVRLTEQQKRWLAY